MWVPWTLYSVGASVPASRINGTRSPVLAMMFDLVSEDRYLSREAVEAEEALYEDWCRIDRYDGFDVGDLNNPNAGAWENDDAPDGPAPVAVETMRSTPFEPVDPDDILF